MKALRFSHLDADLTRRKWNLDHSGYARTSVRIKGSGGMKGRQVALRAHRMVMERIIGRPLIESDIVDHINFDRLDNRRENLRLVTPQQNAQHRRPHNAAGIRGVTRTRHGRWQAGVNHNGKYHYCGTFATIAEAGAASARKRAELKFCSEEMV